MESNDAFIANRWSRKGCEVVSHMIPLWFFEWLSSTSWHKANCANLDQSERRTFHDEMCSLNLMFSATNGLIMYSYERISLGLLQTFLVTKEAFDFFERAMCHSMGHFTSVTLELRVCGIMLLMLCVLILVLSLLDLVDMPGLGTVNSFLGNHCCVFSLYCDLDNMGKV